MPEMTTERWDVENDAVILLYHGITASPSIGIENFSGKHITAERFNRQMAWLKTNAHPMSLREMTDRLQRREKLPPRSIAVTFDDTFLNNRTVALPILQRHHVPATYFVTTGFIGRKRLFWTDKVEYCLNTTIKDAITFALSGQVERAWPLATSQQRIQAVIEIKGAMKLMSPHVRDEHLATLAAVCGVSDSDFDQADIPNYQMMDWDDVQALDCGLCDVGGHSVNHEILAYLPPDRLEEETKGCVQSLQDGLGHGVDLFSYPEGQGHHYNDSVIASLKQAGVTISPSAIRGTNAPGADPFHLRRIMVGFMGEPFPWAEANL